MPEQETRANLVGFDHLTTIERQKVVVVRRRIEHLKKRIAASPIVLHFDRAEASALEWCLSWIAAHRAPDREMNIQRAVRIVAGL